MSYGIGLEIHGLLKSRATRSSQFLNFPLPLPVLLEYNQYIWWGMPWSYLIGLCFMSCLCFNTIIVPHNWGIVPNSQSFLAILGDHDFLLLENSPTSHIRPASIDFQQMLWNRWSKSSEFVIEVALLVLSELWLSFTACKWKLVKALPDNDSVLG